ncbi:8272_t:CDS:2, partial [Gigaspora margarita]
MSEVTFAKFLERCVEQINDPTNTMLSIPSAYESTINYAFEDVHNITFGFAFNNFIQQIIGTHKLCKKNVAPGLEMENLFILNEFKANQYKEAIKLLNNYSILYEELANEILPYQEIKKKYYEILQEETLKLEINNVKIENEKIQNQLERK